jgi:hypothetical protein
MAIFNVRTVLVLALFTFGLFRLTFPAHAADFVVTHTGDSGEGSLRQAIIDANMAAGVDTISFQAGLTGTITLLSNLPEITEGLTITGPGISALTIDGAGTYNVFATPASSPFTLHLNHLTIANALTAVNMGTAMVELTDLVIKGSTSHAVKVTNGQLIVERVTFADNIGLATMYLTLNSTNLLIRDSIFSGNVSTGINSATLQMSFSDGNATIVNTTFADNVGTSSGALSMSGINARLIMDASTFSGNSGERAGAAYLSGARVDLIIANSTFSGNSATTTIGADALNVTGPEFYIFINFSTFSGHDSTSGDGTLGVIRVDGYATVEMTNSIIANNPASAPGALLECSFNPDRVAVYGGSNLTGDINCPGRNGAPTNVDPVLADNGGPTMTHALLSGSNAIDYYEGGCTPKEDQRYIPRPQGAGCDLGAFEFVPPPAVVTMSPASQTIVEGANANVTLTRTGYTGAALTVTLDVTAGTGTMPSDYTLSGGSISGQSGNVTVAFPAGADFVLLNIAALADALGAEPANMLTFALADGADYDLGAASNATVTIPSNGLTVTHTGDSGEGSLRQSIINANTDGVDSTISFAASANGTITLLSTLPSLIDNGTLIIEGNGQTNTIISGNDTVRVLYIEPNTNVTINGVTITRGYTLHIGGGGIWNAGTLTVNDSTVTGNTAASVGGGILNELGGTATLNNTVVSGNTAQGGGGIFSKGTLTVTNGSTITGNSAEFHGGGILSYGFETGAALYVTDSAVSGNNADIHGGGIYSTGAATVTRSSISDNTAAANAGGIANAGEMDVIDSLISGNHAAEFGGGIHNSNLIQDVRGILRVTGSTISDNTVGKQDVGGEGGGIANNSGTVYLTDSTVAGNSALYAGGGVFNFGLSGESILTLIGSTVSNNKTGDLIGSVLDIGGGIANVDGTLLIVGSTVSGNSATRGGGIYNNAGAVTPPGGSLTVSSSTIAANTASVSGDGLFLDSSAAVLNNTILSNGDADCIAQNGGTVDANHTIFSNTSACGALEADGNLIGRDPLLGALITPPDGSPAYYPLLAGSPAIDAGNDTLIPDGLTIDQAGNPRIFGAAVDMGSVEFTARNLLKNGGFEAAGANPSIARKWQHVGLAAADDRKCDTPTKRFAYTGICAFQFKSGVPVNLARVIKQRVDVTEVGSVNDTLTLSLWVQAKKLTAGAKLKVKVRYADGTTGKIVVNLPSGTYSYTRLSSSLTLSKSAVWVETLIVARPSVGTLLIDDLWLTIAPIATRMPVTRSGDGLLPPPPAPDGFRGSN